MKETEFRLVVETRQEDGSWVPTETLPLTDWRKKVVADWITADKTGTVPSANAVLAGDFPHSDQDLWFLPDDVLRNLLDGERGEQVGMKLVSLLPDFDEAVAQRFGKATLFEFYARRLGSLGHDADIFRNLPPAEQAEYIARFVQDDLPVRN